MFLACDFDVVTMDRIARASGVGYGYIYKRVNSKEELFQVSVIHVVRKAVDDAVQFVRTPIDDLGIEQNLARIALRVILSATDPIVRAWRVKARSGCPKSQELASRALRKLSEEVLDDMHGVTLTYFSNRGVFLPGSQVNKLADMFMATLAGILNGLNAPQFVRQEFQTIAQEVAVFAHGGFVRSVETFGKGPVGPADPIHRSVSIQGGRGRARAAGHPRMRRE